jgi:hypothetical protein
LEENHIQDIFNKAQLINEFLYLLGLPNKLGPLGFIALRHILLESTESSGDREDEVVDVIVEPFELPSSLVDAGEATATVEETEDENLRRTRRQAQVHDQHQALLAHQAAENAVLRQQGLDPALLDHQQALQAHQAAERAVRAQHNFVGLVGPSGSIGPSGLVGPSGAVQFRQKRGYGVHYRGLEDHKAAEDQVLRQQGRNPALHNQQLHNHQQALKANKRAKQINAGSPGVNVQHQQALDAHRAAESQVLRQQGRDPALLNHQQALLAHQRAEQAVRAQQINNAEAMEHMYAEGEARLWLDKIN